ncbi:hypothetical protein [Natronolimnohabitans innermongolicus]|uniref:Uncharacterized protein n=1 Tax=Natronolimnohabitans innermongolicus JCM 12255 TaxID=1227499 RepID=L9WV27_9EURY|nr:hypothetical protein [Natronolimnohabitans innermongolicus]ELY53277.1 hypothetical protein C493_14643 [Natronolimnohabitans innermongolicus JCM 12255]
MGRNRRRRSGSGSRTTRRWFLAGGALVVGGVGLRSGSQAVSQVSAGRFASFGTGDDAALLGVEPVASVRPGVDAQRLLAVTNNAGAHLSVSLSLANPEQGELSDTELSLAAGATATVDVSVAADSPTGQDALEVQLEAWNDEVTISLSRTVAIDAGPTFSQQIVDQTQNNNAAFTISYQVSDLPGFERVEIDVENVDAGHIDAVTYEEKASEGTISYPPGGGADGGAEGDTYEFRFRVYDRSGEVETLSTEQSVTADGDDPPGDDLGSDDDPKLVEFSVTNDIRNTNNRFTVDYEVDQLEAFETVVVDFDNVDNDWADETFSSDDAPAGSVVYPSNGNYQGGINGDAYEITVEVYNENGIPVDSGTVQIVAGSDETVEWP